MPLALEVLAALGLIAGPAGSASTPLMRAACEPRDAIASSEAPRAFALDASRLLRADRRAPRRVARLAAALGASLAWDLADLPRRSARLPEPIGGWAAGGALQRFDTNGFAEGQDDAIGALMARWNRLYPPYAFDRLEP